MLFSILKFNCYCVVDLAVSVPATCLKFFVSDCKSSSDFHPPSRMLIFSLDRAINRVGRP